MEPQPANRENISDESLEGSEMIKGTNSAEDNIENPDSLNWNYLGLPTVHY